MENRLKHNYKNMEIWKRGIDIADEIYQLLERFPASERFGLYSQISRSIISIPSNIAEGSSRSNKGFIHFLNISLGSAFELETQLIISRRRKYIDAARFNKLMGMLDELQKMTIGFQKALGSKL